MNPRLHFEMKIAVEFENPEHRWKIWRDYRLY